MLELPAVQLGAFRMRRLLLTAVAAIGLMAAAEAPIAFPDGFRTWTHVGSSLAGPASPAAPKYEGVHHIYANPAALEGYKTGKWADGAVIVYDQWSATHPGGDATVAGERKFIDVMVRDNRRYAATGGWGYTEFAWPGKDRVVAIEQNQAGCDGCHAKGAPGGDHVFSTFRE
jgi:hypothetical protein